MPWGGPYVSHNWLIGDSATAARLNNIESQYSLSTSTFEQDLFTAFVLYGMVCTADGTTLNQLDMTAGVAFLLQTDSTVARQALAASIANQFLTTVINTTYYLDLNPNGTFSFATTHSGTANYLTICQCTTNSSGNISAVTDKRNLTTTLFASGSGNINTAGAITAGSYWSYSGNLQLHAEPTGVASGIVFTSWTGSTTAIPFSVGGQFGAAAYVDNLGNMSTNGLNVYGSGYFFAAITGVGSQAATGSFGVPVIVAQSSLTHVTGTSSVQPISFSVPVSGFYEVRGWVTMGNSTPEKISAWVSFTDGTPAGGTPTINFDTIISGVQYILSGSEGNVSAGSLALRPMSIYAASGHTITLNYQDPGGSPSDYVYFQIWRLA